MRGLRTICAAVALTLAFVQICSAIDETRRIAAAALSEMPISTNPVQGGVVPSSIETVIAAPTAVRQKGDDEFGDDTGTMRFTDDEAGRDLSASASRAAPSSGENPFMGPRPHKWDPEVFNQDAIRRVSHDIPTLLKMVDTVLPKYERQALLDPGVPLRLNHADDDDTSLLEVEEQDRERFKTLSDEQRDAELILKRHNLHQLRDTIALELKATTHLQERLKVHHKSSALASNVPAGRDKELDRLLKSTDELAELNPELKDWADEATFTQKRKEIDGLLFNTEAMLSNLKTRY